MTSNVRPSSRSALCLAALIVTPFISGTVSPGDAIAGTTGDIAVVEDSSATAPGLDEKRDFDWVSFGVGYLGDAGGVVRRGTRSELVFLDRADILATVDLEELVGWQGTTFFVDSMGTQGKSPSELAGDAQVVSNIDASGSWKLYECWLDHQSSGGLWGLRAGLYDVNTEFDVIDTAGLFLNSSHGIGPDIAQSGANGPSIFPTTSLGVRALLRPSKSLYLQGVVLDGIPGSQTPSDATGTHVELHKHDGFLSLVEAGYHNQGSRRMKLAAGGWAYTTKLPDLESMDSAGEHIHRSNSRGAYVLADVLVRSEADDAEQGLSVFARYGVATTDVNRFGQYLGFGAAYAGPLPNRDEDRLGIGVATAVNGGKYRRVTGADRMEVALELAYKLPLNRWLWLEPDLQYVINPNTDPEASDSLVFLTRLEIAVETSP